MTSGSVEPVNPLEAVIRAGMVGGATGSDLLAELRRSMIYVPSAHEVQQDGSGFVPLLLRSPRANAEMVVAFTSIDSIGPEESRRAPYCLQVPGEWLVRSLAPDLGIVIFVEPGEGCDVLPSELARIRPTLAG